MRYRSIAMSNVLTFKPKGAPAFELSAGRKAVWVYDCSYCLSTTFELHCDGTVHCTECDEQMENLTIVEDA